MTMPTRSQRSVESFGPPVIEAGADGCGDEAECESTAALPRHPSNDEEREVGEDVPEIRDAEERTCVGEAVIVRILRVWAQREKRPDDRGQRQDGDEQSDRGLHGVSSSIRFRSVSLSKAGGCVGSPDRYRVNKAAGRLLQFVSVFDTAVRKSSRCYAMLTHQ